MLQLLNRRIPHFTPSQMTKWFKQPKNRNRASRHLFRCAEVNIQMLDKLDLLRRTSEFARLYGIDFYSVISRGSQYRVEAVLLRRAHDEGFIALSPSREGVANQAAMTVKPLILEPRSSFYSDPMGRRYHCYCHHNACLRSGDRFSVALSIHDDRLQYLLHYHNREIIFFT